MFSGSSIIELTELDADLSRRALMYEMVNTGSIRETFALNQLSVNHDVFLHDTADFIIDSKFVIEIGGKNKDAKQVRDFTGSYIFQDDIEMGQGKRIPLWLLGFLY